MALPGRPPVLTLTLTEERNGYGLLQVSGLEVGQEALVQLSLTGAAHVEVSDAGGEREKLDFFSTLRLSADHQLVWLMTNNRGARLLFKVNKRGGADFNLAVREVRLVSTEQQFTLNTPDSGPQEPPGGPESPGGSPGAPGAGQPPKTENEKGS